MKATSGAPPQKRLKACKVEISEGAVTVPDRNSPTDTATASVKLCATTENNFNHLSRGPLESMPWDIVIEILRLAHPKDLISWARTTKSFRAFLMNRRSMHIWKTSRQRVSPPAPDCPSELDEPQYAVLLFTSDCTVSPHNCMRQTWQTWQFADIMGTACALLWPMRRRGPVLLLRYLEVHDET
ncbi:hypothetical protein PYCCODRAFT_758298 [Trametes coccinea BRFM310]|uniref:F-box domain-containing protein n=1 Tax=Trametes coccinea (strain BRFM310) TaxID=1353009 RepID=A0A1Y2J004_TRAC3|nr:hypothetical protein PYCCODRAFT_758298 [Trametes coccinea BRFM310]